MTPERFFEYVVAGGTGLVITIWIALLVLGYFFGDR